MDIKEIRGVIAHAERMMELIETMIPVTMVMVAGTITALVMTGVETLIIALLVIIEITGSFLIAFYFSNKVTKNIEGFYCYKEAMIGSH